MPKIELFKNNTNLALAPASSFTRMVPRYKITHAIQTLNIYFQKFYRLSLPDCISNTRFF